MNILDSKILRRAFILGVPVALAVIAGYLFLHPVIDESQKNDAISTFQVRQSVIPPSVGTVTSLPQTSPQEGASHDLSEISSDLSPVEEIEQVQPQVPRSGPALKKTQNKKSKKILSHKQKPSYRKSRKTKFVSHPKKISKKAPLPSRGDGVKKSAPQILIPAQKRIKNEQDDLDDLDAVDDDMLLEDSGDAIVDVYLRDSLIYQGMFCRIFKGQLFIPMGELFGVIFFPIEVDSKGAKGWFLTEENKFNFSSSTGIVQVGPKTMVVPHEQYVVVDDEIFMNIDIFNSLFPLRMGFNRLEQALILNPLGLLSFEVLQNRINSRRISSAKDGLLYPLQDLDYAAIAQPNLNLKITAGHRNQDDEASNFGSVSGIYRGDLLFMSSVIYGAADFSANDHESNIDFNNFSFTGERVFPDNPYLYKATVGDIIPTQTPIGGSGALERGFRITNENAYQSGNFDTRTFTGKAQPGWEVELYRNGQLMGAQSIAEDGTYLFENVEILFGVNRFRIVMYGPQGQEEVREEVIDASTTLRPGEIGYDFSLSENSVGVFDSDISKVSTGNALDKGTMRTKGTVSVGINSNLELRSGFSYESFAGMKRTFGSLGTDIRVSEELFGLDMGYSSNEAVFLQASMRGAIFGTGKYNVFLEQQFSDKYLDSTTKNKISLGYNDSLKHSEKTRVSYGGKVARTNNVEIGNGFKDEIIYNLSGNFNINGELGNISNNFTYRFFEDESDGDSYGGAQTSYYMGFQDGTLRGTVSYGINEEDGAHLGSATFSSTYRVSPKTSTTLTVDRSFQDNERLLVTNSWSHKIGEYSPYISGSIDDNGNYWAYLGIGLNIGFEPGTFTPEISGRENTPSGASCLVYQDKNYNNVFDSNDEPLENVTLKSIQSRRSVVTDENGRGLFVHLPPMRSTDIEVDENSFSRARFYAANGSAITPRKGKIYELEYPIHLCGAVEGYIYQLKDDKARARPHVPVQAVDSNGKVVGESLSVSGGYFCIEKLFPGSYQVRIDPQFLERRDLIQQGAKEISINAQGESGASSLIFYGGSKTVNVLAEKFRKALSYGEDVFLTGDFSGLDDEGDANFEQPELLSLKDLETVPEVVESSTAAVSAKREQAQSPASGQKQYYAFAIDVFESKDSAERAIRHYENRYSKQLADYKLVCNKDGGRFEVLVAGIGSMAEVKRLSDMFLCIPRLEMFDMDSLLWVQVDSID